MGNARPPIALDFSPRGTAPIGAARARRSGAEDQRKEKRHNREPGGPTWKDDTCNGAASPPRPIRLVCRRRKGNPAGGAGPLARRAPTARLFVNPAVRDGRVLEL